MPVSKLDYAWGAEARRKASSSTIIDKSGAGTFGWLWSELPASAMSHHARTFPLRMKVDGGAGRGESGAVVHTPRSGCDYFESVNDLSYHSWEGGSGHACPHALESCVDPTYLLPVLSACLRKGSPRDVQSVFEGGGLAYSVVAAASEDENMRRLGYDVLEQALAMLEDAGGGGASGGGGGKGASSEWGTLSVLLKSLRDSITEPLMRIPATTAMFVAESIPVVLRPASPIFTAVTKYLASRPFLSHAEIPMFHQLLQGGGSNCRAERLWLVKLMQSCPRHEYDRCLFRKYHVPSLLMSVHDSVASDDAVRGACMAALEAHAEESGGAVYLVNNCGVGTYTL